ncbi:hypothetical protein F5B21DRAFT_478221 [Xylaria acuta]|nr:hypothetical protein F5B21DRAFT_478221 [Xylaria acuta]
MAQQGGTYRPQAAAAVPVLSDSSSRPQHQDGDDKDEKVPGIEAGGDNTRTCNNLAPSDHALEFSGDSPKARSQAHGQNEDEDWAVIQHPEAETGENPPDLEVASHFDITLGWGRYKLTLFSCDMNVRKYAGDGSQSGPRKGRQRGIP